MHYLLPSLNACAWRRNKKEAYCASQSDHSVLAILSTQYINNLKIQTQRPVIKDPASDIFIGVMCVSKKTTA